MLDLIGLVPAYPLISFILLALFGRYMHRHLVRALGVGSVLLAAVHVCATAVFALPVAGYSVVLWQWFQVDAFAPAFGFYIDALNFTLMLVVTCIGFLIHAFASAYMEKDESYARFFACLNLFVSAMLVLIMADNLMLLYLGWEGVGVCSYMLIGFWYKKPENGRAARKAFIMTRVGDVSLLLGIFLLFKQFGTVEIKTLLQQIPTVSDERSMYIIALLLLGGAVGKSAQLPLHTWLPDAMAGPTPVSALIHAATMVTAGVYLIARMHVLYDASPEAMHMVLMIGMLTTLLGGACAMVQTDMKRVLAYSTMSQIGLMFVALGVGAWTAAIFHLVVHACYKALLFLGAGTAIECSHHEQDIRHMGALRREQPLLFWTFLMGSASAVGFPLITAGFYSKDLILWQVLNSSHGGLSVLAICLLVSFMTSYYTSRLFFWVFIDRNQSHENTHTVSTWMSAALVVLAVLSVTVGCLETPYYLGGLHAFSTFLQTVLPVAHGSQHDVMLELSIAFAAFVSFAMGVSLAYSVYQSQVKTPDKASSEWSEFLRDGCGFNQLYDVLWVKPVIWFPALAQRDVLDDGYYSLGKFTAACYRFLHITQTGVVRNYATAMVLGAVVLLLLVICL